MEDGSSHLVEVKASMSGKHYLTGEGLKKAYKQLRTSLRKNRDKVSGVSYLGIDSLNGRIVIRSLSSEEFINTSQDEWTAVIRRSISKK